MKKLISLTACFALLSITLTQAAIISWSGSVDAEWSNGANWHGGTVPASSDIAVIPNGSTVMITTNVTISQLLFDDLDTLTTQFTVMGSGNLHINGSSPLMWVENCDVTNNGSITLRTASGYFGAMMLVDNSSFSNNGSLSVTKTDSSFGGGIFMANGAEFTNNTSGLVMLDSCNMGVYMWDDGDPVNFTNSTGGVIQMTNIKYAGILGTTGETGSSSCCSQTTNNGLITIQTNYPYAPPIKGFGVYILTPNHCFTNNGTFTVLQDNPGLVLNDFGPSPCVSFVTAMELRDDGNNNNYTASNQGAIVITSTSKVTGNGKVSALALDIRSDVVPGYGAGKIEFIDDFNQPNLQQFDFEIYGNSGAGITNGHDLVEFNGNSVLTGDLNVSLGGAFVPNINDEYVLFTNTNGNIQNQLSNVILPGGSEFWEVTYGTSEVKIKLIKQLAPCDQNAQALPITAEVITPKQVELIWDEVPKVDHYEIRGRQVAPILSSYSSMTLPANATSAVISNINPHATYEWMVRPHCDNKNTISGPWSDVKSFITCSNPVNTLTMDATATSAKLMWDLVPGNQNGYKIVGNISKTKNKLIIDVPDPKISEFQISNLIPGLSYNWIVVQNCGMNVHSNAATALINTFQTSFNKTAELEENMFVYPNPASDYLYVNTNDMDSREFVIYDARSKEVYRGNLSSGQTRIDVSAYEAGFYFMETKDHGVNIVKKFIISR